MNAQPSRQVLDRVVQTVGELLNTGTLSDDLPDEVVDHASLQQLIEYIDVVQRFALSLSKGDLEQPLRIRGFAAGALKSLQASLRHLTWQTQQIASGDFDQRVDFMGDFAEAFNTMVQSLAEARAELEQRESDLRRTNGDLQGEIHRRKAMEESLEYQARHDVLTGLPNRLVFNETLSLLLEGRRRSQARLAVMFIDLDNFKFVNDTLGHDVGDALLVETANRLRTCVRDSDVLCRMGGDEFTVILKGTTDPNDAEVVGGRVLTELGRQFVLMGHEVGIGASIGIAFSPKDAKSTTDIVRKADAAMYYAKGLGRNNYRFYSADLDAGNMERMRLERDLRLAIESGELELYYQPRLDPASGEVLGLEALLRWDRVGSGPVSPAQFVPIAEETGLIVQLDEYVIKAACRQQQEWQRMGVQPVPVAVNLSHKQLRRADSLEKIESILNEHGIRPQLLVLEIPGDALTKASEDVLAAVQHLRNVGIRIVFDGFGTVSVPLIGLNKLPIDDLKIGCSLLADGTGAAEHAPIVASVISVARNMNLGVIAVGVEREEQLGMLLSLECDAVQGYLFCRPMKQKDVVGVLAQKRVSIKAA